jgi:hypothetical protein
MEGTMFEANKAYKFVMYEGPPSEGPMEFSAIVVGFSFPLLKVRTGAGEQVINVASPAFISATPLSN